MKYLEIKCFSPLPSTSFVSFCDQILANLSSEDVARWITAGHPQGHADEELVGNTHLFCCVSNAGTQPARLGRQIFCNWWEFPSTETLLSL